MWTVNNPPRWLAIALSIINGGASPVIGRELFQVVDSYQSGFGMATFSSVQVDGSLGGPITTLLTPPDGFAARVKVQHFNAGTVSNNVQVGLRCGTGALFVELLRTTGAGLLSDWLTLGGGKQWLVIPPGCSMEIVQNAYTTTAGHLKYVYCLHPGAPYLGA